MKEIASAMVKAQRQFGPALKTHTNPAFKSKYADLSACIEAVIDALNANGIFLMQPSHESERGVTVETLFIHESGEVLSAGKLSVPATKQDAQGFGSALTYARRYSLMAACGLAPEDDDGHAARRKAAALTEDQRRKVAGLLEATSSDLPSFFAWVSKAAGFEIRQLDEVPAEAFNPILKKLNAKKVPA